MWSGVPFAAVKALLRMFPISNSGQVVLAEVRLARVVAGGASARPGCACWLAAGAGPARGGLGELDAGPVQAVGVGPARGGLGIHQDTV